MARKQRDKGGDDGGGDRWLGTYGDMITLLMAFFVMLYAISQVDEKKFLQLVSGLDVFGNTGTDEGLLAAGDALLEEGAGADAMESPDQPRQSQELTLDPQTQPGTVDQLRAEREASKQQVAQVSRQLDAALERRGVSNDVTEVRADARGVVISVSSDDVLFASGSDTLSSLGRRVVAAIAAVVRQYDEEVVVEGHTDNVPLRRADYTNWNLSTDRAVAVVERLHINHDVDQKRLVAAGYGEFRPLVANNSVSNRARNRRVDVLLRLNEE